jgi:hypothetical protein
VDLHRRDEGEDAVRKIGQSRRVRERFLADSVGRSGIYVIVWLRPIRSSAMMDVTALEALDAAVLVL